MGERKVSYKKYMYFNKLYSSYKISLSMDLPIHTAKDQDKMKDWGLKGLAAKNGYMDGLLLINE